MAMDSIIVVKQEPVEPIDPADDAVDPASSIRLSNPLPLDPMVLNCSAAAAFRKRYSEVRDGVNDQDCDPYKKVKMEDELSVEAVGLNALGPYLGENLQVKAVVPISQVRPLPVCRSKQFWKAGDFDADRRVGSCYSSFSAGSIDHVRVHPKFLHSNATSHKWALGGKSSPFLLNFTSAAIAELLDNAIDEVIHGATFVNMDMLENHKDGCRMLVIEDDGGGMSPHKMRHCMSLGYSAKSKLANTIGQYGNGFKTSTMRLGADVIVFSRSLGEEGNSPTQSIGMLSYTFLRNTGQEDIIVPILDYERQGEDWNKIIRSSPGDWSRNVETILQWSPYSSEDELLDQFNQMKHQGTRVIIYNLWEDEQGNPELDFDMDLHDIQIRGVNRDEKKIEMAEKFPNSRHFLTYRHSLKSYASILYLRLPAGFRIILRGKNIEHHNIVEDMMLAQEDAKDHIDVQGFNVYHKNRLIKPFWRVWNAAGSSGRGIIGVLEANFVEPAHDKQGFERTIVLSRLEARLVQMQKTYWSKNCDKIGYVSWASKKLARQSATKGESGLKSATNDAHVVVKMESDLEEISPSDYYAGKIRKTDHIRVSTIRDQPAMRAQVKTEDVLFDGGGQAFHSNASSLLQLEVENCRLKNRLKEMEECYSSERERCRTLEAKLKETQQNVEEMNAEQENLLNIFSEERSLRDQSEESLKMSLMAREQELNALKQSEELLKKSLDVKDQEMERLKECSNLRAQEVLELRTKLKTCSNFIKDLTPMNLRFKDEMSPLLCKPER
ncbi:hypothetical protein Sjap_023239 [Stephania japonica]|uniref:Morc S5 domain-containing protein n=1 Tax=Stephania japonica TaxID=461633 RepID=A0AAP0EFW5_9MAGN